jgi:hypothetical protein
MRQATKGEACLDAGKAVRVSVSVLSTADLDRLLLAIKAIFCCSSRSKGRPWLQNRRLSGECRLKWQFAGIAIGQVCRRPVIRFHDHCAHSIKVPSDPLLVAEASTQRGQSS